MTNDYFTLNRPQEEIIYISKCKDIILVHTKYRIFITNRSLKEIDSITKTFIVRTHRSYLVNIQKIKEIIRISKYSYEIELIQTKTKIPLSSRYEVIIKKSIKQD